MSHRPNTTTQHMSFEDRLASAASLLKEQANALSLGRSRDALLRKAKQMETASEISVWLSSPGRNPPR
jgi:hypothetical protein